MRNDLDDWQRKANEAQKNYEDSSKQNKTQELEISELKQQLTLMKYQIESLEIEKKDKYQLQEKLTAAEQKYKELLKRNEREEGEFSSVENLNEILKGENLQLRVDIGREREEKDNIEIKVSHGFFYPHRQRPFTLYQYILSIQLTKREAELREITLKLNILTEEIEKMKANVDGEKGTRDSLEKENDSLKTENTKLGKELESLQRELESIKQQYEKDSRELEKLRNEETENQEKIDRLDVIM